MSNENPSRTIVLTIQHPAHVHFFCHAYQLLREQGHTVHVFVREKSVTVQLLNHYGIEHTVLAGSSDSLLTLLQTQLRYEWRLFNRVRHLDPDVIAGIGGLAASHVAQVLGVRGVVFTDTEHARLSNSLSFPFASVVCTPEWYSEDVGTKHHRYPGFHELAYLHPAWFDPEEAAFEGLSVDPGDRYVVLRSIKWGASHDIGQKGFDDITEVIARTEATGVRALVTSEETLPPGYQDRRAVVEPHHLHTVLSHAELYIGEGSTMALESAVLGTPAIYVNSLGSGVTDELAQRGLLFHYKDESRHERAIEQAVEILERPDVHDWNRKREALLDETCDVTAFVVETLTDSGGVD